MKKIMFNDKYGLTRAVLEGYKTQTRRIFIPQKHLTKIRKVELPLVTSKEGIEKEKCNYGCIFIKTDNEYVLAYLSDDIVKRVAPYKIGEEIAIAKPYAKIKVYETLRLQQKLNRSYLLSTFEDSAGWNNKMFVKSEYMPNRIKVTNISAERLQDISDEDCMKEGIMEGEFMNTWDRYYYDSWGDVPNHITFPTPIRAFSHLIDKVNGAGTWNSNPWVFVYDFELVK